MSDTTVDMAQPKRPKGALVRLGEHARLLDRVQNTNAYLVALLERADVEWRAAYGRLREAGWASAWVADLCRALGPVPAGWGIEDVRHHLELVSTDALSAEVVALIDAPANARGDTRIADRELGDLYIVVRHFWSHDHAVRELVGA